MATDKEKAAQGGVIMTMSLVFSTHLQGLRKAVRFEGSQRQGLSTNRHNYL